MEPNQNPQNIQNPLAQPTAAGTDPMVAAAAARPVATAQPVMTQATPAQATPSGFGAANPAGATSGVMGATGTGATAGATAAIGEEAKQNALVEQQMEALLNEPLPEEPVAEPSVVKDKKKPNVMLIGLICAIAVAVVGIGFGVFMMISGNSTADSLNKQITTLKKQNSELSAQIAEAANDLSGEEALALINEMAVAQNLGYTAALANVYVTETGDEDLVQYNVRFLPAYSNGSLGVVNEVLFVMNEDGEFEFTLPALQPTPAPEAEPAPEEPAPEGE